MAIKICFSNQKGGVGKTASAQQLIAYLAKQGKRVLAVDLDPQWNLSIMFGFCCDDYEGTDGKMDGRTVYQLFKGKPASEVIVSKDGIDFVLGSSLMAAAESEFSGIDAYYLLKDGLESVIDNYDYVVVDTAPTLSILTINAYAFVDGIVIPYKADSLTRAGVLQLGDQIGAVRKRMNPGLKIYGVLVTMYDSRTNASKKAAASADMVAEYLKTKVFGAKIRNAAKMRELADEGVSIFDAAPKSAIATDYELACKEIIEEVK